jgi:hypothetical protein
MILHTGGIPEENFDHAVIQTIADNVAALEEIPPEVLAFTMLGEDSAYLLMYGAWKTLEAKLYEVSCCMQAKRREQELIDRGRTRP